ncbi:MAG: magnesium transporter [Methylohalobius sp.]|nr:magnesium transporter [Methylohalobius sp.]
MVRTIAFLWFGKPKVALTIGAAMVINLCCAALAGATIPLLRRQLKVDPTIASGVFLTTVTDVIGFLAFLGLATWWLF